MKTTVAISEETLRKIKKIKEEKGLKTYDEAICLLIDSYESVKLKEALKHLILSEEEADELLKVILNRRRSWWKK